MESSLTKYDPIHCPYYIIFKFILNLGTKVHTEDVPNVHIIKFV